MSGKFSCNKMDNTVAASAGRPVGQQDGLSLYTARGTRKYVNAGERACIIVATSRLGIERALFVETLVWTGARVSEVLALTPRAFQVGNGVVAIKTLKRRKPVVREVPIPPALMHALDEQFAIGEAQQNGEASQRRLWHFCRVTAWRIVKNVMKWAGVRGCPARPHGLRHGFGVGALQASVPLTLVQRWMGHARLSTTAIYADASGPEERAFAERYWRFASGTGRRRFQ
jgi:integrase